MMAKLMKVRRQNRLRNGKASGKRKRIAQRVYVDGPNYANVVEVKKDPESAEA
jgi:hypothetical protein